MTPTTWQEGTGPRTIRKSRCAFERVNANRTATLPFVRRGVARSRFVRVATAGRELRAGPVRELVDDVEPVLPPDCEADPPAGAEGAGAEGAGAEEERVGVVTIGGATGLGAGGVVTRGGVTGGVVTVTGGVLIVTGGGAGAGGSAVVTGSDGGGGGGGSAVVIGRGGGGGSAVVTGSEGVVTVTPGRGGTSRASACAAMRPAKAAPRPQRPPRRDILDVQRATRENGCGRELSTQGVLSSSASGSGAGTGSAGWSWPCSWSCE